MVKIFPDPSTYKYLYKCHHPVKFQPQYVEILETRTNIWKEFLPTMRKRKEFYPNISYVFLSNNKDFEIKGFFELYPDLKSIYNVVEYTSSMYAVLETKQYPFCIVVSPNNKILYQGSTMETLKLQPHLHKLNVMASRLSLEQFKIEELFKEDKQLSCYQLSMSLSGITKGGAVLAKKQQNYNDIFQSRLEKSQNDGFLPAVSRQISSLGMSRSASSGFQRQQEINIFQSSGGLSEKIKSLGGSTSDNLYTNAFIGVGEFQQQRHLMGIKNLGPTAEQLRVAEESINPQLSRQKFLLGLVNENDDLEIEKRKLTFIQKGHQ
ncbi:hypothetical protein SS50377_21185 [Spironucleus salmonicida]|uniref:Uncharacterized protein n=1 Tax=Spironucleus salmonicida TaxID=348837 RepID=V6LJR6_9EUKA|nr:hypothetical protein SS50377_21185 [Spironucleus salmonicida]|eukprot:EST43961.1 Hypothetical protein SS50377_16268 [Spironucleus salmonicida]